MRSCARCGRAFAEVLGAPEQVCPHCGLVARDATPPRSGSAPEASVGAPRADPVGAAAWAFRLFAKRYARVSVAWLPAVVANFVASWAILAYARAQGLSLDTTDLASAPRLLGVQLPATLVVLVVELACWSLVARVALREARGGDGGGAPVLPRPKWGAMLAMGAMLAVAFTLGLVLLVIPFCIFLHWYMFAPAALATGEAPSRAFESSRAFSRARHTAGFTALVILVWLAVEVVLAFVLEPMFEAPLRAAGDVGVALGDALAGWVLGPLVPLFPAAFWALARTSAPAGASPTPGGAPPAERRATTACPQCGTLIPFTPTGAPVAVVCPECGHAGRIV